MQFHKETEAILKTIAVDIPDWNSCHKWQTGMYTQKHELKHRKN